MYEEWSLNSLNVFCDKNRSKAGAYVKSEKIIFLILLISTQKLYVDDNDTPYDVINQFENDIIIQTWNQLGSKLPVL